MPNLDASSRARVNHGHARVELLRQSLNDPGAETRLCAVLADRHSFSIIRHGQQPGSFVFSKRHRDLAHVGDDFGEAIQLWGGIKTGLKTVVWNPTGQDWPERLRPGSSCGRGEVTGPG